MNKKGNVLDVTYIMIVTVVLIMTFMISWTIMNELQPKLDARLSSDAAHNATANAKTAIASFDSLLILVFVGLIIAAVISAFFIQTHPLFFVGSLLMLIIFMLFIPIMANVFDAFATNSDMSVAADEFNISTAFVDKLPTYFVIASMLVLIALYAKFRRPGGEL